MTTDISVVRWDPSQGPGNEYIDEYEYDGGNSSSRLFERSRIKALAGMSHTTTTLIALIFIIICVGIDFISYLSSSSSLHFSFYVRHILPLPVLLKQNAKQRNVKQYKRKPLQNGWIRIWCVPMPVFPIYTLTCATASIWSNCWKCCQANVFQSRPKAKCVYIAWKM